MKDEKKKAQNRENFKRYYAKHKDVQKKRNQKWSIENRTRLNYLKNRHSALVYLENYASLEELIAIEKALTKRKKGLEKHD